MNQCERAQRKQKRKKENTTLQARNCTIVRKEALRLGLVDTQSPLCVAVCVYVCCAYMYVNTHACTHIRAYMCRHYGRIVFVLISGSGECLQHSRRGTKQGVGEMRHRGVVNGWQKTASSKSNQKKTNWFCLRVCVRLCTYVWMCGFYRFIAVALLCLSFQFYFNFSTARSPEPRCAWLAGWLAQWLSAAIFISNWEAINVRVRWQH